MRAMWKGSISFGLVNIPIRLFTATEEHDVSFRQLHRDCHHPIRYMKFCPVCEREVNSEEIIRGYEYAKGNYVVITDEDLENLPLPTLRAIEIIHFVDVATIDPIYYEKTYYLSPGDFGEKPYKLLYTAMQQTGKAAIAKIAFRTKEHLCLIRFYEQCLSMSLLHFPNEIRPASGIPVNLDAIALKDGEIEMANALVEQLSGTFDPAMYHNDFQDALREVIETKIAGAEVTVQPAAAKTNVVDLMDALRASLEAAKQRPSDTIPLSRVQS